MHRAASSLGSSPPFLTHNINNRHHPTSRAYSFTDQNDESLRKWKESLGIGSGNTLSDPNDPRQVILLSLGLEVEGRSDIVIDLTQKGSLETLSKKPFTIKEGATFRMKARFKVQHQILSGLKYVQVVSRMGVKQKMQEMIVSSFHVAMLVVPVLTRLSGLILAKHHRQARVREEVYVVQHRQYGRAQANSTQSSPRPHPPACSAAATTRPSPSSWTTTSTPSCSSTGPSTSRRTGEKVPSVKAAMCEA